jgi:hypothetical protein
MFAPSSANFSAIALPIPRAAPVMSAVFPLNNPIVFVLNNYFVLLENLFV